MKKIFLLISLVVLSLFLFSCTPQPKVPAEQAFDQMEELSDEELDAALAKNQAAAGQAYKDFSSDRIQKVQEVKETASAFQWLSCGDTDSGIEYEVQGTVAVSYLYGGKSGNKSFTDHCAGNSDVLAEYYCKVDAQGKTYGRSTRLCEDGCVNGTCGSAAGRPAICGNRVMEPGEKCDDGNTADGDGCSAKCKLESLQNASCEDSDGGKNYTVQGTVETAYSYNSQQMNKSFTDYCISASRVNEYFCSGNMQGMESVTCEFGCENGTCKNAPLCGNAVVEQNETCDDGNTLTESCAYGQTSCQVCSQGCLLTAGETSYCGDLSVDSGDGEQCDDGNVVSGDGCSSTCSLELNQTDQNTTNSS